MMRKNLRSRVSASGFTLIELLIVVAIIAILAAIAVPNFLEAQTRSKVSRVKSDMRSLRTGLEAYAVDNNHYPPDQTGNQDMLTWLRLTTPVAYISSVPGDAFIPPTPKTEVRNRNPLLARDIGFVFGGDYQIKNGVPTSVWGHSANNGPNSMYVAGIRYWIMSYGPNLVDDFWNDHAYGDDDGVLAAIDHGQGNANTQFNLLYDPTNGTVSHGDLIVSNKRLYN